MKVQFKTNKNLIIEFEADTQRDVFEQLAKSQEVFSENVCGKCKKDDVRYVVRTDKDENKYYEINCQTCRAKLMLGCSKLGGGLFTKKKLDDKWLPDNGWVKYDKETNGYV
jgi:DNA-directed RNA polymerase subunit RPC12/RpoP